jgi:hypothetical protein
MTLEMRFQSLEDGVPDVIVKRAESGGYLPIRYFESLIEDHLEGRAHIELNLRPRAEPAEDISIPALHGAMRATDADLARRANDSMGQIQLGAALP